MGEYLVEPKHTENRFKYFLNDELLFQVGDLVIKTLNDGMISSPIEHIEFLRTIDENNIHDYLFDDPRVTAMTDFTKNELTLKSHMVCSFRHCENKAYSGRNRVNVKLELEHFDSWGQNFGGQYYHVPNHTLVTYSYSIQAWRQTWVGFWYVARRTLSADLKVNIDVATSSGTHRYFHSCQQSEGYPHQKYVNNKLTESQNVLYRLM